METVGSNDGLDGTRPGPVGSLDGAGRCGPSNSTVGSTPRAGSRSAGRGAGQCEGKGSFHVWARIPPSPAPPDPPGHELDDAATNSTAQCWSSNPTGPLHTTTNARIDATASGMRYNATNPVRRPESLLAGVRMRVRAFNAIPEPLAVPTATRHRRWPVAVPVAVLAASARARPRSG
jgi:hypothetical protein